MNNILEYLERTAEKYPGRIAVEDDKEALTWKELADLSRRIGTAAGKRIASGDPVVILAPKGPLTLAAMFGAVYGGGFYVNGEPALPPRRLKEIFRVLRPKLVLIRPEEIPLIRQAGYTGDYCLLHEAAGEEPDLELLERRRKDSCSEDILYGIFTSGSTGTPKGITVSHRAVIDFITHFTEIFGIDEKDRIGNQAPFDFDVSVKDIYSAVMTGAALVLIPRQLFSVPAALLDYLCEKKATVLIWAVSALTMISSLGGFKYRIPSDVRKVMFSGEVMPANQLACWQEALPEAEFVNLYGPTEITCNCTYYPVQKVPGEGEKLPIGKAFPGRRVFLLNEEGGEIREPEQAGEICVAGESLSLGYYHDPAETEKSFQERIFPDGRKERYYRTGDLGFLGKDGNLYFSGRKDFQIKFNGHRIELEEIERLLDQMQGIEKSCCVTDHRKTCLAAFYMGKVMPGEIRLWLKKRLPGYMVPRKIFQTEKLPLTKNGKTDRKALQKRLEDRR
ncbi:MAG TPA: amino acid adenylation domain-containing protein [Candidatus Blautia stercorigallinarum]|uniref:Amino acid adenylation domain-containing protein n=1 Tax=Candidatus Blautia stercorigallinarum TaxID=2838501 RepID=A0A9D1TGP9_9FIRM|nr:amino acid adenylation domain-containing protein [Candidatus Blautia stercorigallinarum]